METPEVASRRAAYESIMYTCRQLNHILTKGPMKQYVSTYESDDFMSWLSTVWKWNPHRPYFELPPEVDVLYSTIGSNYNASHYTVIPTIRVLWTLQHDENCTYMDSDGNEWKTLRPEVKYIFGGYVNSTEVMSTYLKFTKTFMSFVNHILPVENSPGLMWKYIASSARDRAQSEKIHNFWVNHLKKCRFRHKDFPENGSKSLKLLQSDPMVPELYEGDYPVEVCYKGNWIKYVIGYTPLEIIQEHEPDATAPGVYIWKPG